MKIREIQDLLFAADLCVFEEKDYFLVELCTPRAIAADAHDHTFIEQVILVYLDAHFSASSARSMRTTHLGGMWSERPSTDSWKTPHVQESRPDTDEYSRVSPRDLVTRVHQDD